MATHRRRITANMLGVLLIGAYGLAACGDGREGTAAPSPTFSPAGTTSPGPGRSSPPAMPSPSPPSGSPAEPPSPDSSSSPDGRTTPDGKRSTGEPPTCVQRALDELSLEQRVGQLFMGGVQVDQSPAFVPAALGEVNVGSVLLLGNTDRGVDAVTSAVQRARTVAGSPAGVEPIVAADQEGGRVQRLQGSGFERMPSAAGQARMAPEQLVRKARAWAAELRAAGVNLNLAPVADVVPASVGAENQPIGALDRGYGSDPAVVGEHVAAFVAGMADAGVATAVKHFPGLGAVRGNTDFSSGVVDDVTTRSDPGVAPFRDGVEAGAPFLMVSLATYTQIDANRRAVFSPVVIDGMVRDDLGFDGVVISDDVGQADEVSSVPPGQRALRFLRAGGDLVIVAGPPSTLVEMTQTVSAEARSDHAFRATVDRHVRRVLAAKERMGLLDCSD